MGETIRVCCAILLDGDLVLCAQRSASMSLPHKWEFPGGKIEPQEQAEEALQREICEELGVEIELLCRFRGNIHRYPEEKMIELIPFLSRIVAGMPHAKEHQSLKWVPVGELMDLDWAEADVPIVRDFIDWQSRARRR